MSSVSSAERDDLLLIHELIGHHDRVEQRALLLRQIEARLGTFL